MKGRAAVNRRQHPPLHQPFFDTELSRTIPAPRLLIEWPRMRRHHPHFPPEALWFVFYTDPLGERRVEAFQHPGDAANAIVWLRVMGWPYAEPQRLKPQKPIQKAKKL